MRWLTVACVLAASGAQAKDPSSLDQGEGKKAPGTWTTFVLTSGNQFRPPPPDQSARVSQLGEVVVRQQRITPERKARVEYWDQGPITHRWSEILLKKIAQYDLSPVRAARDIALLHVAMSDAVVACWDAKYAYNVPSPASANAAIPSYPSEHATVAEAAAAVLSYLFPLDAKEFHRMAREVAESRLYAGTNVPSDIEAGQTLGAQVGALVVHRGQTDGSDQMYSITIPAGPGYWSPPLAGVMGDPTAGSWKMWVLANADDVTLPPPPSPGSPPYQADVDAILSTAKHLTNQQKAMARYWADGPGTITPAGHWLQIAEEAVGRAWSHDPPRATRALALVSVAMADTFIACWKWKYTYWTARPYQVIPGFTSYIKTPPFPGYPSGHSTQSGAASEVLAYLFPRDAAKFRAMAEEAAISRLYGGIHFPSDNNNGLLMGREVGRRVVEYTRQDWADKGDDGSRTASGP